MSRSRTGWVTVVAVLFLIGGGFNLIVGLIGLGVDLGGGNNIENATVGDWPTNNLEGISIALIAGGGLQFLAGAGILARNESARVLGLVLSSLVILLDFAYYRLLDGWALSGILLNLLIIVILATKHGEFR